MSTTEFELQLTPAEFDTLLVATLPDGAQYGRRSLASDVTVLDTSGVPVLAAGAPGPGRGLLVAALAESTMQMAVFTSNGLSAKETIGMQIYGSRFGIVSYADRGDGSGTVRIDTGGSLYRQVFDAAGIGPRPAPTSAEQVVLPERLMNRFTGGDDKLERSSALKEVARAISGHHPAIAQELLSMRFRHVYLPIATMTADRPPETNASFIDTPSGILVLGTVGGLFTRAKVSLAGMPVWAVWQNILEMLPTAADLELWNELAKETEHERVVIDPAA